MQTEEFLKQRFKEYYFTHKIDSVPNIKAREFGIGEFGKKITQRHLSFESTKAFNQFLREKTPFFVSYSVAQYEFPSRKPMEAKHLLKSDIIYEFDADDLKTDCQKQHDSWKCQSCGKSGKGRIENCTNCGEKVKVNEWVCGNCLKEVKKQVFQLLDFLEKDFGFSEGISINFSGAKGFHVHLRSEKIQNLSQAARIELLDYLTANNILIEQLGFTESEKMLVAPKLMEAKGWSKKILLELIELFERKNAEEIAVKGNLSFSEAKKLLNDCEKVINGLKKGLLIQFFGAKKSWLFWKSLIDSIVEQKKLKLDRQNSVDLSRIIRVPETIHGSTGLIAKSFSINDLKEFNPFEDAVVFSEKPVKLLIKSAPRFELRNNCFGPFENQVVELPEFAAIFLLARGDENATLL